MIFVMDRNENVLSVLTNNGSSNSCPYFEDVLKENLDTGTSSYEFKVPTNHPASQDLQEGGYIARADLDGHLLMFTIMELQESHGTAGDLFVYSENAGLELLNDIVRPIQLDSVSAEQYLDYVLRDTRWTKGEVEYFGVESFTLEYKNVMGTLQDGASTFSAELRFRVKMKNGKVSHRYVDMVEKRGTVTKKRFVYGKDITAIKRTVDMSSVVTALIGIGEEDLNFKSVAYSKANGKSFDKPLDQDWVGDEDALQRYGQQGKHIFGTTSHETKEPETLLKQTWAELQRRKTPNISYELEVALLERLANIEAESVRLGDTVHVIDEMFSPALYLEARVRELETSFSDPQKDKATLGNYKLIKSSITSQMRAIQSTLLKKEATWDTVRDALNVDKAQELIDEAKEEVIEYVDPIFNNHYDHDFSDGKGFWTEVTSGKDPSPTTSGVIKPSPEATEGSNVLEIQGMKYMFSKKSIAVNVQRAYQITMKIKQSVNPSTPGTSGVYLGVATLDKDYNNITGGAGDHRYFGAENIQITVEDGWQVIQGVISGVGDLANQFRPGTVYVRPMFLVNYEGGNGTVEIDYVKFEDVTEGIMIDQRFTEVELKTTENSILSTVLDSVNFTEIVGSKADVEYVEGTFATNDALTLTELALLESMALKVDELGVPILAERLSTVEQTAQQIDFKFTNSGGVNLLQNSVGYAGDDFWIPTLGLMSTLQNDELAQIGAGSGWYSPQGNSAKLEQTVAVVNSSRYTLSFFMNKSRDNGTNGEAGIEVWAGEEKLALVGKENGQLTEGWEKFTYNINTELNEVKIVVNMGAGSETVITNLMVNIGDVPLQWTLASGEVYNTNVLMDMNGIRVISDQYNGYTAITPQEFSGYAEVIDEETGTREMKRIFTLNKDTTEVTKLQAEEEIRMTPLKIMTVNSGVFNGWAFVPED